MHYSTIYAAIYRHLLKNQYERLNVDFWSGEYEIQYKKVKSSPLPLHDRHVPAELEMTDSAKDILKFMAHLHSLYEKTVASNKYDPGLFLCRDVDMKMEPLLKDPLSALTQTFPDLHLKIYTDYRFLMSAKKRHEFFKAKTFGLRDLTNFDLTDEEKTLLRPVLPRDERPGGLLKPELFKWFCKHFPRLGTIKSNLKVTFTGERGVGEGVAREFYAMMSLEFSQVNRNMWIHDSEAGMKDDVWIKNVNGLYPALIDKKMTESEEGTVIQENFRLLGQFVAKAIVDGRVVDLPFNKAFIDLLLHPGHITSKISRDDDLLLIIESIKSVYPTFGKTLENLYSMQKLDESLCIPYDIPIGRSTKTQRNEIEHGIDVQYVTKENFRDYILICRDWIFERGVQKQIESFKEGFNRVFPFEFMREYSTTEFAQLILFQVDEDWSIEMLRKHVKPLDSSSNYEVDKVVEIMSEFNCEEKKKFLRFVTGSPKLPIGGFEALQLKISTRDEENSYPQGRTCFNSFMIPRNNNKLELTKKIKVS
ncbi:2580_t:CDS:2 [Dentiscutata erythropus]|uniref:2580_t:CDS:1 n=1 Tax=Dentiscutata erythropus TaxID=1348616 RepID=A0A9N9IJD7_9GLOM|nr:2580_t:CDS:2 [Dentiscutata erythropus]